MGRLIMAVAVSILLTGPAWADACGHWHRAVSALDLANETYRAQQRKGDKEAAFSLTLSAYGAVRDAEQKVAAEAPDKLAREAVAAVLTLASAWADAMGAVVAWGFTFERAPGALPITESLRTALKSIEEARQRALELACP